MADYNMPSHILWERIGWSTQPEEEIQTANRWLLNPLYGRGLSAKFSSWILLSCQFRLLLVSLGSSHMILSFASTCYRKSQHWMQGLCVLLLVKWHEVNIRDFYMTCATWTYSWWLGTIHNSDEVCSWAHTNGSVAESISASCWPEIFIAGACPEMWGIFMDIMNRRVKQNAQEPWSLEGLANTDHKVKKEQMNFTHQVLLSNERASWASFD